MEERRTGERRSVNAREALQGKYPTPAQRDRETGQAFVIVIVSCLFLCAGVGWFCNSKSRVIARPSGSVVATQGRCEISYETDGGIVFSRRLENGSVMEDLHYYPDGRIEHYTKQRPVD